jgi:hypothetical protein
MKKQVLIALIFIASTASVMAQKAEVYASSGVAIKGYDPVAYFKQGKPVMGNEKFSYDWNNAKWVFASKENLDAFSSMPAKYAPQYGGYCAYGMSEGHKAPTDPNAWTIVNGKLYLNYSVDVKQKWSTNQQERIVKANKNWEMLKDKE